MAILIQDKTRRRVMTPGERRLAHWLERHLDEEYLIWFNVPIGPQRLYPDFILLHPERGLVVLEVKDWKLSTLHRVDPDTVTLLSETGLKQQTHPLQQARNYVLAAVKLLEQDPQLVQHGDRFRGRLAFPYGYGVVLTHISRAAFDSQIALTETFDAHLVICKDEMAATVDPGQFQERLWALSPYQFGDRLTPTQVDRVRWHFFPELRISHQLALALDLEEPEEDEAEPNTPLPDLLRIMDLQQEQLARSIGEGHRIIHGVAGSGKTLILAYRCQHLAQSLHQPILVLCFNVSLAAKLRSVMALKGVGDRVMVRHFHGWCADQLRHYQLPRPNAQQVRGEAYVEALVSQVMEAVEAGTIPAGRYGAVMIDEGHDFRAEWLALVARMVSPQTDSLLLLYDDAQSIYDQRRRQAFSFKRVGIQAQGRTTILRLNYRNTQEVLAIAYAFAKEVFADTGQADDDTPMLVQPQSAGRPGAMPELTRCASFQAEVRYLIERVQRLHHQGIAWNEMAIIYRAHFMGETLSRRLQQANIPVEWVNRDSDSRHYDPQAPSIKLLTMHSSKGLEFPVVLIPGMGYLPSPHAPVLDEARLLYVAMTRAVDQLIMTGDRPSAFMRRMEKVLSRV